MIQRERVTDDIVVFSSDLYVQVTAGVISTGAGAIIVDTLLYPDETRQIKHFVETRLKLPVIYVINTHHHADHTTGTSFFGDVPIISHALCRKLLDSRGRESLQRSKENSLDFNGVELVLPTIVFEDHFMLRVGGKSIHLEHSPGHSLDSITVWVKEDNVLFAADTVMSIPHFVDGDYDAFLSSLRRLQGHGFETIVQGHGEVVLRGEVERKLKSDISYLEKLKIAVDKALGSSNNTGKVEKALASIKVSACGKSSILLNGAVEQLHYQNVMALARKYQVPSLVQAE